MTTLLTLLTVFLVANTVFLIYTIYLMKQLGRFKLNDQSYMYERQEHLAGIRTRNTRKKRTPR